jgi:hypothetical protein
MRKSRLAAAVFLVVSLAAPPPADAWGFAGHRMIMARAIDLLPPELKPFFERFRDEVVVRVTDPDTWRSIGWDEEPNHFVDCGLPELGAAPFAALPRERDQAVARFGTRFMDRVGYLPWRASEMFGNLRRAFEGFGRRAPYAVGDTVLFAAVASHYIQDAHQPLHASNNYDGQLTGNTGIHARFERDLIERFASRLSIAPAPAGVIGDPRDYAFEALLASYTQVGAILDADNQAVAGKDVYDDDYFEKFFVRVKPVLERRLNEAVTATASLIVSAWQAAGKPALSTAEARPPQKVRK